MSQRPGAPSRIGRPFPAPSPSPLVPNGPQDKRSSRRRLLKAEAFHDLSSSLPQFSRLPSTSTLSPPDLTTPPNRRHNDGPPKGQKGLFLRHHPLRPNPPLRNLMARLPLRPLLHPRPPRSSPQNPSPTQTTNPPRPSTPSPPPSSSSAGNAPTPPTTASPRASASATSPCSPTGA